ncbi:hypothetical protein FA15DRAFT_715087, partial [Coprinopsis marcescibilis]
MFSTTPQGQANPIVVIKYIPALGDFKRAPSIFCAGRSVINIYNSCEVPFCVLFSRPYLADGVLFIRCTFPSLSTFRSWTCAKYRQVRKGTFRPLHSILPLLSYTLKA